MYTTKSLYTKAGFQVNQHIHWEMLTDDQCEAIVATAIELLERTGVDILNKEALAVFEKGGCWIDQYHVRIPSTKTAWALRETPSRITLCRRDGKRAMLMETNHVYYGPGHGNNMTVDIENDEVRPCVKEDVVNIAKICEGLDNVDFVMDSGLPTDVAKEAAPLHAFEALATYSSKPILQAVDNAAQATAVMDMAFAVKGSREAFMQNPFAALLTTNTEPLALDGDVSSIILAAAQNNFPVIFNNYLVTGYTAPQESAGALVVALANSLAALVLAQLVNAGTPFVAGGFFTINDLNNEMQPYGAPEISLIGAGFAEILRYLRLPSCGFAGGTDAMTSDAQMGLEAMFSTLHAGLAGANLIYGAGQMESGNASSACLVVLADELTGMTRRVMRGVAMDEDRLARGVIDDIQPGGHYLGSEHTMYYFKNEQYWPKLMNRMRIDDWTAAGAKSLGTRMQERTRELLASYTGAPLDDDTISKLQAIVKKAVTKL